MNGTNSTLVETVSINYEDFNESFLTCGTCLCTYDGEEHTPKLLQCSHTVCLHCLTRMTNSQIRDAGTFRCPICRELITVPRGGVSALPPSFLVNQLLDLMSRQRREVIPRCSVHINQELLFCETCDVVFCTVCTVGPHSDATTSSCEHTIIPFSVAIKRMSEILLYKANECISKLSEAQQGISSELNRLDSARTNCLQHVDNMFQSIEALINQRRLEISEIVHTTFLQKKSVLEEQNSLIENEKSKVEQECQGLQYQVEVRNITQRIELLTHKLDSTMSLSEPRENSFLTCDMKLNDSLDLISQHLAVLGKVRTSTTLPGLCSARLEGNFVVGIENFITLITVDYHGNNRKDGGDPVRVELLHVGSGCDYSPVIVTSDCDDGTYRIRFRTFKAGLYTLNIFVIGRSIKDNPLTFSLSEHHDPTSVYGSRGVGDDEFMQPVSLAIDEKNQFVYVLDTGNSRIKVLTDTFEFVKHIFNDGLLGRSCTGLALSNNGLVIVNWRSKYVTETDTDGETITSFTYDQFQEPANVAVDKSYDHILVVDNGKCCVFVFDMEGNILFQVGKKGTFNLISSVSIASGKIIVADSRIQAFSSKGDFLQTVFDEGKGKGRYGGITVDCDNRILVSRTEQKGKAYIQLLSLTDNTLNQCIDSYNSKLKRPGGIAVTNDYHVVVVDLGNNCIKKYRYW